MKLAVTDFIGLRADLHGMVYILGHPQVEKIQDSGKLPSGERPQMNPLQRKMASHISIERELRSSCCIISDK